MGNLSDFGDFGGKNEKTLRVPPMLNGWVDVKDILQITQARWLRGKSSAWHLEGLGFELELL